MRQWFFRSGLGSLFLLATAVSSAAATEDWPRFRGPTGQGLSQETGLPQEWSAEKGLKWKQPIPGEGWSSPILWGDRVFVTSVSDRQTKARVLCLDRTSGKILWDQAVLDLVPLRKEQKNSYASPTPVTDGKHLVAVFGDGTIVGMDFAGTVLWKNQDVRFYSRHGLGASPVLHDGLLIMPFDGSNRVEKAGEWPNNSEDEKLGWRYPWDQARIVALDVRTGTNVWTARRGKSRIAHITPNVIRTGDTWELLSNAGDAIQGFDPRTGELRWTVYSQGEGVTPSFAVGDGLVFTSSGFEKTTLRTVRLGGRGDVTATHVAWEQRRGTPTQSSLLYVSPLLYTITDGGIAHAYDGKTGEVVYSERVGGNHSASPLYADGRIYFLSEEGETTVIKAGPKFEVIARNPIGERCQASLAVSRGNFFLRSEKHLYCIGQ